jgi:hypothetical protein
MFEVRLISFPDCNSLLEDAPTLMETKPFATRVEAHAAAVKLARVFGYPLTSAVEWFSEEQRQHCIAASSNWDYHLHVEEI